MARNMGTFLMVGLLAVGAVLLLGAKKKTDSLVPGYVDAAYARAYRDGKLTAEGLQVAITTAHPEWSAKQVYDVVNLVVNGP